MISKIALSATYTIWLGRSNKMSGSWELEERPEVKTTMQLEGGSLGPKRLTTTTTCPKSGVAAQACRMADREDSSSWACYKSI